MDFENLQAFKEASAAHASSITPQTEILNTQYFYYIKEYLNFSFTQIQSKVLVWARNLTHLDVQLNEQANKELMSLQERLSDSRLKSMMFFRENLQRTKRNTPLPSVIAQVDSSALSTSFEVFLLISVTSPMNSMQPFDTIVVASSPLLSLLDQFPCLPAVTDYNLPGRLQRLPSDGPSLKSENRWAIFSSNTETHLASDTKTTLTIGGQILESKSLTWFDLGLRLFYPYTLTHNGMCSHIIVVKQIVYSNRHLEKCQAVKSKDKRYLCRICEQFNAAYVLMNETFLPDNPSYICVDCQRLVADEVEGAESLAKFCFQGY